MREIADPFEARSQAESPQRAGEVLGSVMRGLKWLSHNEVCAGDQIQAMKPDELKGSVGE